MNSTEEAKECHRVRYRAEPISESPLRFTDRNLLLLHRWEDSRPEGFWEKKKTALNRADFDNVPYCDSPPEQVSDPLALLASHLMPKSAVEEGKENAKA
jgi:hypothetical protein